MNLCDYNTIKRILSRHGFTFSKALGQNFLINPEVCPAMAAALDADGETGVLEIGPGIGVLTKELCAVAGRVVAIELDSRLLPVLDETLAEFDNLEIIEGDALELDLNSLIEEKFAGMKSVKICANLPYYITSPIIIKLLESRLAVDEIVVMVQKEAAERLTAKAGERECGSVSVFVEYYAQSELLFDVSKESFMPAPKVNSSVIRLRLRKKPSVDVSDEAHFFRLVKAAFSQRRKTAVNCLSNGLGVSKGEVASALEQLGKTANDRAESFTIEELAALAELI